MNGKILVSICIRRMEITDPEIFSCGSAVPQWKRIDQNLPVCLE